jgi:hypothetical protein
VSATLALLWLGLALQLANVPGQWREALAEAPDLALLPPSVLYGSAALTVLVCAGTVAWLVSKLAQQRNWARVTCLASAAVELAFGASQILGMHDWTALSWWLTLAGDAVTLGIVVLLTLPRTRAWFGTR